MVGRNVFCLGLITIALIGSRTAVADSISFTGNVDTDFGISASGKSSMAGVSVITTPTNLNPISSTGTGGTPLLNYVSPGDSIKEVALQYNSATDTMSVGIQTWGVAGSVPGSTIATGNGMVVGFEPLVNGTYNPAALTAPTFVAGTANYSAGQSNVGRGPGLDGFNVATYTGGTVAGTMNLLTGFGTTITAGLGNLAFNPGTSTPGYEFTITNFSKLLAANPNNGVVVMTQDGDINVATSKDELVGYMPVQQAQELPEPTSLLVWAGLAGGIAWGYRRRSRRLAS